MTPLLRIFYRYLRFCVELVFRVILMTYYLLAYLLAEMPMRKLAVGYRTHSGALQKTGLWCIFAIAQDKYTSNNLIAFLSCLREAGYNVILVNNGRLSDHLVSTYLPYCHTIVERPRGGRDFGGYQCATKILRALEPQNDPVIQVIYCNDSNFVRPSSLELLLDRVVQMDDDYICIMEVFQIHYHVQSWFFAISGRVFDSPAFNEYWRNYTPYSYRRHSINKGEVGISKHLMRHGVYPQPLYSQGSIMNLIFSNDIGEIIDRLINLMSPDDYKAMTAMIKDASSDRDVALSLLKRNVMERIASSNTMHSANLLLLKATAFPFLKKDLVYRAEYFFPQVEDSIDDWAGTDAEHLPEILAYFRSRDSLRWARSPAATLARMGLI
jgi:Rhamnan synthesis protein F